jgi:multidrug efflux pump subunit AcrA (membrane-fusion protein)
LTAYKQRTTPVLAGKVTYVSADSFIDETTKSAYYKAFIQITAKEHNKLRGVPLYPGMPVDGIILTGQRTFWRYLIAPLQDSFAHAFREQ